MVFFVCEGCNETLKKAQVDKHARICRSCHAVTCVDCQVTFYGDDYDGHTTCISEAEKYEKSLYKAKPGAGKPKAQDIWTSLIENITSQSNQAPASVRPFLPRLATLSNVPRNKKKFINFSRNSLNIRSDAVLEELWNFLDQVRVKAEADLKTTEEVPSSSVAAVAAPEVIAPATLPTTVTEDDAKEGKKSKKDKKRKRDEEKEVVTEVALEEVAEVTEEEREHKKSKKEKKEKKSKKDKSEA